ncbi:MAG: hypothetical protein PVG66_02140 [Chromatiales bacterium]|jgi:hypothetical protein
MIEIQSAIQSSVFLSIVCAIAFSFAFEFLVGMLQRLSLPVLEYMRHEFLVNDPAAGLGKELIFNSMVAAISMGVTCFALMPIYNWSISPKNLLFPMITAFVFIIIMFWPVLSQVPTGLLSTQKAILPHMIVAGIVMLSVFYIWSYFYVQQNTGQ